MTFMMKFILLVGFSISCARYPDNNPEKPVEKVLQYSHQPSYSGKRAMVAEWRVHESNFVQSLYPYDVANASEKRLVSAIFDRLFYRSPSKSQWLSRLIRKVEPMDNQLHLQLAYGVTWHDGEDIVAKDICFSLAIWGQHHNRNIPQCVAEKDSVVLTYSEALDNDEKMKGLSIFVLPKHHFGNSEKEFAVARNNFKKSPIGSGAMRGEIVGRGVVLTAQKSMQHKVNIETIKVFPVASSAVEIRHLQSNDSAIKPDMIFWGGQSKDLKEALSKAGVLSSSSATVIKNQVGKELAISFRKGPQNSFPIWFWTDMDKWTFH